MGLLSSIRRVVCWFCLSLVAGSIFDISADAAIIPTAQERFVSANADEPLSPPVTQKWESTDLKTFNATASADLGFFFTSAAAHQSSWLEPTAIIATGYTSASSSYLGMGQGTNSDAQSYFKVTFDLDKNSHILLAGSLSDYLFYPPDDPNFPNLPPLPPTVLGNITLSGPGGVLITTDETHAAVFLDTVLPMGTYTLEADARGSSATITIPGIGYHYTDTKEPAFAVSLTATPVPEPGALVLAGIGTALALLGCRRRQKRDRPA